MRWQSLWSQRKGTGVHFLHWGGSIWGKCPLAQNRHCQWSFPVGLEGSSENIKSTDQFSLWEIIRQLTTARHTTSIKLFLINTFLCKAEIVSVTIFKIHLTKNITDNTLANSPLAWWDSRQNWTWRIQMDLQNIKEQPAPWCPFPSLPCMNPPVSDSDFSVRKSRNKQLRLSHLKTT